MVHVSPHGMPSGGSRGGNDSLGSVLLAILIVGGGMIGLVALFDHCNDARRSPPTIQDAARPQPPG